MKFITVPLFALALLVCAVPVSAAETAATVSTTVLSCLKTTVTTRETALKNGWNEFSSEVSDAYDARAAALSDAYASGQTRSQIKADVKTAWKEFRSDVKGARADWKETRTSAWSTYKTSAKACKSTPDLVDSTNAGSDVSGS